MLYRLEFSEYLRKRSDVHIMGTIQSALWLIKNHVAEDMVNHMSHDNPRMEVASAMLERRYREAELRGLV